MAERVSGNGVARHGRSGKGQTRRSAIPTATARWVAAGAFYSATETEDRSWSARMAPLVATTDDARHCTTLRSLASLNSVNGPIHTKRSPGNGCPAITEPDSFE